MCPLMRPLWTEVALKRSEKSKTHLFMQVIIRTLLTFTAVAILILILRYVSPDEVPLPTSFQESIYALPFQFNSNQKNNGQNLKDTVGTSKEGERETPFDSFIVKEADQDKVNEERRRIAAWNITSVCIGVLFLTSPASVNNLHSVNRLSVCGLGGVLLLCGLIALTWIDQDDAIHNFGHTGGVICPFVPLQAVSWILVNVYLMINLGIGTWIRVSVWVVVGIFIYLFYGRKHSLLLDAVYVPTAHADEIYCSSVEHLS